MAEVTIYANKDALTHEGNPTTNYGSVTYLITGVNPTSKLHAFSLFDMADIPSGKTIVSAIMTITPYTITGSGVTANIHRVTESWVEGTINWGNAPSVDGTPESNTLDLTATGARTVDITTLLRGWYKSDYSNYGLAIKNDSAGSGNYATCRSREYATQSERPKILVTYSKPGGFFIFLSEAWERHKKLWTPKLILPKENYC